MKFRFVSDFHTEFWPPSNQLKFARLLERYLPSRPDDTETVLCCAGDMGTYRNFASTYAQLLGLLAKRFWKVALVPGNHSWYRTSEVWGHEADFFSGYTLPENVHYLDNACLELGHIVVVGSCLWTDFLGGDAEACELAQKGLQDYKLIRRDKERRYFKQAPSITPADVLERHRDSIAFIQNALERYADKKCLVLTHHAPSFQSVPARLKDDELNPAYCSDLSNIIERHQPVIWHHGHLHERLQYPLHGTEVICNALGYHGYSINKAFDPHLLRQL